MGARALPAGALTGARSRYPEGLVIATKGGYERSGPNRWSPNGRPEHLKEACEGSLRRLRLDRIDVYQFHTPDPRVQDEESVGALKELQDEGKVRHIGISNVSVEQLAAARAIADVVTVQNRYNLGDDDSEEVLARCEELGIGFLPWRPLGGSGNRLQEIARAHDATPSQISIAWLLQYSRVMLPIPGTKSVEHLEENLAAAEIALSDDEINALAAA